MASAACIALSREVCLVCVCVVCCQTVPHFSTVAKWSNQWVGATAMWLAQGKLKKKYNIDDERAALFSAIEAWNKEVRVRSDQQVDTLWLRVRRLVHINVDLCRRTAGGQQAVLGRREAEPG